MLWQAEADFRLRLLEGYAYHADFAYPSAAVARAETS